MKVVLISFVILFSNLVLSPVALAAVSSAVLRNQSVQVIGEEVNPTSCRLYRKRLDQFLQRENEAYRSQLQKGRVSLNDVEGLLHILQRAGLPIEAGQENILWTLNFDLGPAAKTFSSAPLIIKLSSPYLQWETTTGFFPDHFQVVMSEDRQALRVTYRLSYMEACLAPLGFSILVSDDQGTSIQMSTSYNKDLLE